MKFIPIKNRLYEMTILLIRITALDNRPFKCSVNVELGHKVFIETIAKVSVLMTVGNIVHC